MSEKREKQTKIKTPHLARCNYGNSIFTDAVYVSDSGDRRVSYGH